MAISNFIPEIWSAVLLTHLDNLHVYASLMNRDYEGDITACGDTVHINQIGAVTVGTYTGTLGDPQELDGNHQELKIDQARYFNFSVKDVIKAQSKPDLMNGAMERAGYAMNDNVDAYLAGLLKTSATAINADSAPIVPTAANAYDYLVDMGTKLSENNVPKQGRWAVIPPWYHGLLQKDPRFVGNGTSFNQEILQEGLVGSAAGFRIYVSNNVPNTSGTKYKVMAGTNAAGTFAEQLVEVEALRAASSFSDIVRGLHVFGAKVVEPKAVVCLTVNKA